MKVKARWWCVLLVGLLMSASAYPCGGTGMSGDSGQSGYPGAPAHGSGT